MASWRIWNFHMCEYLWRYGNCHLLFSIISDLVNIQYQKHFSISRNIKIYQKFYHVVEGVNTGPVELLSHFVWFYIFSYKLIFMSHYSISALIQTFSSSRKVEKYIYVQNNFKFHQNNLFTCRGYKLLSNGFL